MCRHSADSPTEQKTHNRTLTTASYRFFYQCPYRPLGLRRGPDAHPHYTTHPAPSSPQHSPALGTQLLVSCRFLAEGTRNDTETTALLYSTPLPALNQLPPDAPAWACAAGTGLPHHPWHQYTPVPTYWEPQPQHRPELVQPSPRLRAIPAHHEHTVTTATPRRFAYPPDAVQPQHAPLAPLVCRTLVQPTRGLACPKVVHCPLVNPPAGTHSGHTPILWPHAAGHPPLRGLV